MSFVDDALEFANKDAFPVTGEEGKIYVALDTDKNNYVIGSNLIVNRLISGSTDPYDLSTPLIYFTIKKELASEFQKDTEGHEIITDIPEGIEFNDEYYSNQKFNILKIKVKATENEES